MTVETTGTVHSSHSWRRILAGVLLVFGLTEPVGTYALSPAFAQDAAQPSAPVPPSPPPADAAPAPVDALGRSTPAGMVAGFVSAIQETNYERAAEYLDLGPGQLAQKSETARQLQRILDRGGLILPRLRLSDDVRGYLDDGLQQNRERFGMVRTRFGDVDLIAERVERDGARIWLISAATVARIPFLGQTVAESILDTALPRSLIGNQIWGAPVGHWLALPVFGGVAFLLVWLLTKGVWAGLKRSAFRRQDNRVRIGVEASLTPIRILIAVLLTTVVANLAGVSIVARQYFGTLAETAVWVSLAWIAWRVIDAVAGYSAERVRMRGNASMLAGITFIRRSVKTALVTIVGISVLGAFGFNVTAGLAALGIGGIAIALGAQKTIEHFVGSLTLVADQPVRIGDFCRFGTTMGTVEDIGMRSTRIRTLDRTLVTVPNGQFASMEIENYSRRDRFWFHPMLDLRYETTAAQMREVLKGLRSMLDAHDKVISPARVRLIELGQNALRIEVFAYVSVRDVDSFLEVQEELTLQMMELIEEAGTGFAFGSQTLYIARDRGIRGNADQPVPEQTSPAAND